MQTTKHPEMVVTVINYFNDKETLLFITNQIVKQKDFNGIVCVVNNGSNNADWLNEKCKSLTNVFFIDAGKNTGYFGGALLALNFVVKELKSGIPDFFVLSNTDIAFDSVNFFSMLKKKYSNIEKGMIGPRIISSKFSHEQNPYYIQRISPSKLKRLIFIFSFYPLYIAYQILSNIKSTIKGKKKMLIRQTQNVYAIHGCIMVFSKSLLEKEPMFFENAPFLFGEEIYAAEVCRMHKLAVVFEPSLIAYHNEHSTTGLFKSKASLSLMRQSLVKVFNIFFK